MDVFAVAALLSPFSEPQTEIAWKSILEISQSANLRMDGSLHFSWHVVGTYDLPALQTILAEMARACSMFEIQTTGFGVFSSDHPVLYLPIVKTIPLSKLHQEIWNKVLPISDHPIDYYSPSNWVPHVTLANEETDFAGICKAGEQLMRKPLNLKFKVDHLAILYRVGSESGILGKFPFGSVS